MRLLKENPSTNLVDNLTRAYSARGFLESRTLSPKATTPRRLDEWKHASTASHSNVVAATLLSGNEMRCSNGPLAAEPATSVLSTK